MPFKPKVNGIRQDGHSGSRVAGIDLAAPSSIDPELAALLEQVNGLSVDVVRRLGKAFLWGAGTWPAIGQGYGLHPIRVLGVVGCLADAAQCRRGYCAVLFATAAPAWLPA